MTTPLLPLLLAFQSLDTACRAVDGVSDDSEAALSGLEQVLAHGEIATPDDLLAKALYLQACGRVDPGLIPAEALDTLVAGIIRLHGPQLSQMPASPAVP